jgi:protein-disulfide isomerase
MSRHLPRSLKVSLVTLAILTLGCARSDAKPVSKSPAAKTASVDTTPRATASTGAANVAVATNASGGVLPQDSISGRADHGRILGDSTVALWVVMVSDFQCPYCKAWHDAAFTPLMNDYVKTGKIRLAFLNMPLSIHPNAMPASEAAMCASVQNKFWPMHEALFASQAAWEVLPDPKAKFDSIAGSLGVNIPAYHTCIEKHLTVPLIQADRDRARRAGVNSTPTFFVGNQTLTGSDADIRGAVDAALKGTKPGR